MLLEAARIVCFANSPKTLFKGLIKSSVYQAINEGCTIEALQTNYEKLVAKKYRTPLVAGLAYALLINLLAKTPPNAVINTKALAWGVEIASLAEQTLKSSHSTIITVDMAPRHQLKIEITNNTGLFLSEKPTPGQIRIITL